MRRRTLRSATIPAHSMSRVPLFGWLPHDMDSNEGQSAYQIKVEHDSDSSTVWDSGKVASSDLFSQQRHWSDAGPQLGDMNAVYPTGDGKRDIPDYTEMFPRAGRAVLRAHRPRRPSPPRSYPDGAGARFCRRDPSRFGPHDLLHRITRRRRPAVRGRLDGRGSEPGRRRPRRPVPDRGWAVHGKGLSPAI